MQDVPVCLSPPDAVRDGVGEHVQYGRTDYAGLLSESEIQVPPGIAKSHVFVSLRLAWSGS